MDWDLPLEIEVSGQKHPIRNDCDFRVILDVLYTLKDEELPEIIRLSSALEIFLASGEHKKVGDFVEAVNKMFEVINAGKKEKQGGGNGTGERKAKTSDWEHDYQLICSAIIPVLGYDVRDPRRFTHWYTFTSVMGELPESSTYMFIIGIRQKLNAGKKLEKHEEKFYRENHELVDLPLELTEEEEELFALM